MTVQKLRTTATARFGGDVQLKGTTVRGLFLKPGTFRPHVNGEPLDVDFPKDVILDAYRRLKERVDAGEVEIRLTHPDLQDLPIRFGLAKEVRVNKETGEVWLTESQAYPEMEKLLTDKARETIQGLALSMTGPIHLEQVGEDWRASRIDVEAVDIVDVGAFADSWITPTVPAGLAARDAAKAMDVGPVLDHLEKRFDEQDPAIRKKMISAGPYEFVEFVDGEVQATFMGRVLELTPEQAARVQELLAQSPTESFYTDYSAAKRADSQAQASGGRDALAKKTTKKQKDVNAQMPTIEGPSDVPEAVREELGNDDDRIAVYIATYNEAIEAGATPEAAHEAALDEALEEPEEPEAPQEPEAGAQDDDEEKEKDAMAKAAAKADAKASKLEKQVKHLQAKLEARDKVKGTLEARVADLEAKAQRLEAEKAEAEAQKDVEDAIVKARKATPAEKESLLEIRRDVGAKKFAAMIQARGIVAPPVGELGHVPKDPDHDDPVVEAAATVQKYGLDGVFNAGLVEVDGALRAHLAASYPSHPLVRKHCKAELSAIADSRSKNGSKKEVTA